MDICEGKIKEMQKYVPFLGKLIENLKKDKSNIAKLSQMQLLYNLLTKPDKGITLNTLVKCEEVLEKVFGTNKNKEIDKPQMSDKKDTDPMNGKDATEQKEECNSKSALVNNGSKEANVSSDQEDSQVSEDASISQETSVNDTSPECFSKQSRKVEPDGKTETSANEIEVNKEENNQEISHSPDTERDSKVSNIKNKKDCSEKEDNNETTLPENETKVTSMEETEDDETTVEERAETAEESNESTLDDGRSDENVEDIKKKQEKVKMDIDEEDIKDKKELKEKCSKDDEEKEVAEETVDKKKKENTLKMVIDKECIDERKCPSEDEVAEETIEKDITKTEKIKILIDEECIDKEEYSDDEEEEGEETIGKEHVKKTKEKAKVKIDEECIDKEPLDEEEEETVDNKDIKQTKEKVKMEIDEECISNEEYSDEEEDVAEETLDKKDIKQSKEKLKREIDEECIVKEEIKEECPDDEEEEITDDEKAEDILEIPKKESISKNSRLEEDEVDKEKEVNNLKTNNCKVMKEKSVTPPKELSNSKENDILPLSDDDDNLLVPLSNAAEVDDYDIVEKEPPKPVKNKSSPTRPNKSDIFNDSIDSKNYSADELSKLKLSENDSIKKIELKPKGPSDKPAVVYFIKKNNNPPKQSQPVETIELLESDSDDDDVILVSEVGLKKKPTPKIIMVPKGTRLVPRPKPMLQQQLQQKSQPHILNKSASSNARTNKPMFAIASVESISQRVNNVKSTPIKAPNTSNNVTNQKKQSPKSTPPAKPACKIINSYSKQVSTDTSVDCSINGSPENESNKDIYMNKEWLENFLTNLLSPTQIKSSHAMDMLQAVLDRKTFDQIRDIVQLHDECASEDSDIEIDKNTEAIREIFIKRGIMTEVGKQLCSLASQDASSVFTTDRRNGQVTSKSRKSKNKPNNDDEYAPNVMLCMDEEVVSERRRSLRRESKLNRKQYFAYDNEDDEEFIRYIDEQARIQSNNNKKKKTQKRPPPSSGGDHKETKPKKQRLRKGASIETFETELLTPTWVEESALCNDDGKPSQSTIGNDDDYEEPQSTNERSSLIQGNINPDFGGDDDDEDDDDDTDRKPKIIDETSRHTKAPIWPFKNVNRIYHCRSDYIDTCLICNTKIQFVVSHYVNQHRESEVIISRLTKKDVDFLVRNVNHGFLSTQRNTNHIYASTCIFCKRNMSFALRYWWEHYTMHTGEYGYECNKCFLRRPRRQHAQKHANDCRVGTGEAVVKIVYDFDKKTNKIEAYICKLCNFIQLHRDNLVKHLETQHEFTTVPEIAENLIKVVLLQISRPYSDPAILTNESFQDMANEIAAAYPGLDQNSIDLQSQFMQYTDDLSFAICDMLAADDDGQGEIVTGDQIAASQQQESNEVVDE